jgi:hypothetical protein
LLASSTQYDTTSTASYAMRDGLRGTEKVPRPKEKTSLHLGDGRFSVCNISLLVSI